MIDPFEENAIRDEGFNAGIKFSEERFAKLLEAEQARTKLGFIQYATIEKLLGNTTEGS